MAGLKNWVTVYNRRNRLVIGPGSMQSLGRPDYVHIFINEKEKQMYICACDERDNDAFAVDYAVVDHSHGNVFVIHAKVFIRYLLSVIGAPIVSESLSFEVVPIPSKRVIFIDLRGYKIIPYEIQEDNEV